MAWEPQYTEDEVREAVATASSISAALRQLGLRAAGSNFRTFKKLVAHYAVSTEHFNPNWVLRGPRPTRSIPLHEILVVDSAYNRGHPKRRLYESGLKARSCELCGQGEQWHGRAMSLILDHINGVGNDNRIENLRIVCPNCAATLDTHCGRKSRIEISPRQCRHCGGDFMPKYPLQRFCSHACGVHSKGSHDPKPHTRKVERPPYERLVAEISASSFSAVARSYGVSDNAVRKWIRWYEAHHRREEERTDAA
jgi:hypothetical protein